MVCILKFTGDNLLSEGKAFYGEHEILVRFSQVARPLENQFVPAQQTLRRLCSLFL